MQAQAQRIWKVFLNHNQKISRTLPGKPFQVKKVWNKIINLN